MAASSRRSFYLTIRDIRNSPIGSKVNLIAKAIEIGVPRKSGGSDYFLTLKLVDETEPTPGFSVNIFEDNLEKLPRIKFPGDIISLQCVELNVYGGDFFCTFKRRISSFALFDGKAGGDLTPYQTSLTRRFLASNADEKLVLQLRALSLRHQQEVFKTLLLCNIESDKQLDIVCKVLDVYKTSTNDWIVLVWDGTDSPVLLQNDLDMEAKSPIRPELYDLPREVLHALPKMGSIVEIFVDKVFEGIYLLKGGGHWVKFYNIIFNIRSGVWRGVVQSPSKVRIVCAANSDVLHRKRIYEDRLASYEYSPLSSICNPPLTVTDSVLSGYSTLRASLTHPEVVHVFRSIVRVIASYPWRAGDLCSPNGRYRVRLTLEDPTARIHAYIYEEDGENFFGGYPAQAGLFSFFLSSSF
ncbi:protection of telomeres protein 1a-like isoform X3 [Phalaenopsis equestris]|uniref:protection of telomeres protein 1a-like isoform X3 n=1 Tax=Phalaenopsis equestris TaxID=78828 RepID=UPI0009E5B308|nr:protection of telomeres protein 1a-like isoform X3 [Phalaenopsis equestris]